MGACSFRDSARGKNMSEAYKNACHEAVSEYGNDSYNGTISTTSGVTDLTNEFKRSKLSINEFIEKHIDRNWNWEILSECVKPKFLEKLIDRCWHWGNTG